MLLQKSKWYRRRDGKVVGPATNTVGWFVGGSFYHANGKFNKTDEHPLDLIEEIDPWVELNACLGRLSEDARSLDEIADILNVGADARVDRSVIVENVRNLYLESRELAAGQCVVEGGIVGLDGGNCCCKYELAPKAQQTTPWHVHNGGIVPVHGDSVIDFKTRDGDQHNLRRARHVTSWFYWKDGGYCDCDIVAWRYSCRDSFSAQAENKK